MKESWKQRPGAGLFLLISYGLWAAVSLRWITEFIEHGHIYTWAISGILLLYGLLLGLDPKVEMGLYRIAQEALNNIAKHTAATKLDLQLAQNGDLVSLSITNNGQGFDPDAVPDGRVGLQGMAERVAQMNGELQIKSAPGQGTNILVEVPL